MTTSTGNMDIFPLGVVSVLAALSGHTVEEELTELLEKEMNKEHTNTIRLAKDLSWDQFRKLAKGKLK